MKYLATALLTILTGFIGYEAGFSVAEKNGAALLLEQKNKLLQEYAVQLKSRDDRKSKQVKQLDNINYHLVQEIDSLRKSNETLKKDVKHASFYRDAQAKIQPVPACVFTKRWVQLYNNAIGASVSTAASPSEFAGKTRSASALDYPSGINQSALLKNIIAHGERCQKITLQLNHLIDALDVTYAP